MCMHTSSHPHMHTSAHLHIHTPTHPHIHTSIGARAILCHRGGFSYRQGTRVFCRGVPGHMNLGMHVTMCMGYMICVHLWMRASVHMSMRPHVHVFYPLPHLSICPCALMCMCSTPYPHPNAKAWRCRAVVGGRPFDGAMRKSRWRTEISPPDLHPSSDHEHSSLT